MLALPLLAQGLALTAGPISQCEASVTNMQGKTLQIPMPGEPTGDTAALDFEVAVLKRFALPPHQEVKFILNDVSVASAAVLHACQVASAKIPRGAEHLVSVAVTKIDDPRKSDMVPKRALVRVTLARSHRLTG